MPNPQDINRLRDGNIQHHLKVHKQEDDTYTAVTNDGKITGTGADEIAAIRDVKKKIVEFYAEENKKHYN